MKKHNRYILHDGRIAGVYGATAAFFVAGIRQCDGNIEIIRSKHLHPHPDREHVQAQLDVWAQCKRLTKIEVYE